MRIAIVFLYCESTDTIEHHLVNCPASKKIWGQLSIWVKDNLSIHFPLTECEIIFGIANDRALELKIINFLILIVKWYINKVKSSNKSLYFFEVLQLLRHKLEINIHFNEAGRTASIEWQEKLLSML